MNRPDTVEAYLAAVPEPMRGALEDLRTAIRAAAPGATETIAYRMPAFRENGRTLVSYAAFKDHCSLFPMSLGVIASLSDELKPYRSGRGTLRFVPERPIPAALVRTVVRARVAEHAARGHR